MISKRQYQKNIKELENLTDMQFELDYDPNDDNVLILSNNEVWFHGRDCYADLLQVLELCYKARQKAYLNFRDPNYVMKVFDKPSS